MQWNVSFGSLRGSLWRSARGAISNVMPEPLEESCDLLDLRPVARANGEERGACSCKREETASEVSNGMIQRRHDVRRMDSSHFIRTGTASSLRINSRWQSWTRGRSMSREQKM